MGRGEKNRSEEERRIGRDGKGRTEEEEEENRRGGEEYSIR